MITIVVPVGPSPVYRKYLPDCMESVYAQTTPPDEIVFIDDQAHLGDIWSAHDPGLSPDFVPGRWSAHGIGHRIWRTPWLSGVAHAFNFGVALARNDLVIMLGSDDRLEPWAVGDCLAAYDAFQRDPLGYYYMDVKYSDGEEQSLACHAAMVSKALWRHTGGFPVESAVGAPDTMLVSIMLAAKGRAGNLHRVASDKPPYWYRRHDGTDTASRAPKFFGAIHDVRDVVTGNWSPPEWTRNIG